MMVLLKAILVIVACDVVGFIAGIGIYLCRTMSTWPRIFAHSAILVATCGFAALFPSFYWLAYISVLASVGTSLFCTALVSANHR